MQRRSLRLTARLTAPLTVLVASLAIVSSAGAAPAPSAQELRDAARVANYWTPQRMRNARPLEGVLSGTGKLKTRLGSAGSAGSDLATASYKTVETPDLAPYSVNGRIFIRRKNRAGYCSGTAINSPTRQLVLTAGHCINSGREGGKKSVWSTHLTFVPAYNSGLAPFGTFIARRKHIYAIKQWTKTGNPTYDVGAFLTLPNSEGINLADAVGGGANILLDATRHQQFETFGYPGQTKRMQTCNSPYIGDDILSNPLPGPPTLGIQCQWAPGASGGGWMINGGTEINGLTSYLHVKMKKRTFGPYFATQTVGKLIRGL